MADKIKKAYRVTWMGIESIVAARTPGEAKAMTVRSAAEVYPNQKSWKGLRCVQEPKYDDWAKNWPDNQYYPVSEEMLKQQLSVR